MADGSQSPGTLALAGIEELHLIGRGGSATVYRGRQPAFHRDVAVKVLDAGTEGPGPGRFSKEIRALGSLSGHPHVVPLYEAGELDGHAYLVMPFLSGGSLADRLGSGPLPPDEVARMGVAVADALEAAHALGMLHRDIKPANVLFNSYGEPQLADFGIARFADSTMTHGLVAATVGYAAPEVLSGQAATPSADVYSLGATLHAALGGSPPFVARPEEPAIAFAVRVIQSDTPPLHHAPPALASVVRTAMARDPAQRFPTAAAMKAALIEAGYPRRADLPVGAAPAGGGMPSGGGRRRAAVAAAILALAGGGTAVALTTGGQRAPRPVATAHRQSPTTSPSPASAPQTAPATTAPATTVPSPAASSPAERSTPTTAGGSSQGQPVSQNSAAAYVRSYYALINAHSLSQSWTWLSPAYQQRLGYGYYQRFWNSVASVDVLHVAPGSGQANITIRYHMADGSSQTEQAVLSFTTDPTNGRQLIADTTVVG